MEEIGAMMVAPSLGLKNLITSQDVEEQQKEMMKEASEGNTVDGGRRRTVSILAVAPTVDEASSEPARATVFVGAGSTIAPAKSLGEPPTTRRRTPVPEVQTVNGYGTKQQNHQQQQQQLQTASNIGQRHQQQQQNHNQQSHQSAQHVVKIRINPEVDTGRVISTVRLISDQDEKNSTGSNDSSKNSRLIHEKSIENDIIVGSPDHPSIKRDDGLRLSGKNSANDRDVGSVETCVRISVVNGKSNDILQQQRNNRQIQLVKNHKNQDQRQRDDMVQQRNSNDTNSTSLNRSSGCFYYGSFQNPLTSTMVISSGQCSPSDTLDSGTCSDLDGTPPPLPKKKNSSTVLLGVSANNNDKSGSSATVGSGQHNRNGSLTSSGADVDSDDNESNISCDSLNSTELAARNADQTIRVNGITPTVGTNDVGLNTRGTKDTRNIARNEADFTDKIKNHAQDITDQDIQIRHPNTDQDIKIRPPSTDQDAKLRYRSTDRDIKTRHQNTDQDCKNQRPNTDQDIKTRHPNTDQDTKFQRPNTDQDIKTQQPIPDLEFINNNNNNNNYYYCKNVENEMEVKGGEHGAEEEMNERNNGNAKMATGHVVVEVISDSCSTRRTSPSFSPSASGTSSLSKASSTPRVSSPVLSFPNGRVASPVVKECTYEERKREQDRIDEETAAADFYANYNRKSCNKYLYDDDRFYKFHINENQSDGDDDKSKGNGEDKESEEFFAGYKILDREAIRSAKGTVRGVKNRVRAGIATFLQKPSSKDYKAKDAGKVVVYVTTMSIVRETYFACIKMLQILKTHMVKYEVRDMFMSKALQTELKERIGCETIQVPQLFIDGQYIGNADAVERLNESGELRRMFKPYKSSCASTTCITCGGCRLLPCTVCNGSKKSPVRNDFMMEFCWLRCMNCDEVGLVRCPHC